MNERFSSKVNHKQTKMVKEAETRVQYQNEFQRLLDEEKVQAKVRKTKLKEIQDYDMKLKNDFKVQRIAQMNNSVDFQENNMMSYVHNPK